MRILTWNLWWRFGPWQQRKEAILSVLRDVRPDIVCLQEVWTEGESHLAERFASELGMEYAFARAGLPPYWPSVPGEGEVGVGNAVLSRWPVRESAVLPLPTAGGPVEGRVALYALVDTDRGTLPVFTTHLHAAPAGSAVRGAQATALARFVAERGAGHDCPPVVGGDFNAEADSDEMRLLSGVKTAPVVPGMVLIDLWRYARRDQPSATWSAENPYIAPPSDLDARIDYLFVALPAGPNRSFAVRSIRVAGAGAVGGVWPSDHLAVLADLALGEQG